MLALLIIAGVLIFVVSTYGGDIPVIVDDSELGIPSPVINRVEPSTSVTPIIKDTAIPVEKKPEPVLQPAQNGQVLLTRPTLEERPVSTFSGSGIVAVKGKVPEGWIS
jgi:hypothetical protein